MGFRSHIHRCVRLLVLVGAVLCYPLVVSAAAPSVQVCLDYHCDQTLQVSLNDDEWERIRDVFAAAASAVQERAAISRAIGMMERFVGDDAGTADDAPMNTADSGERGQLDCIAESTNSATYLQLFEMRGLLRAHTVEARVKRTRWLFAVHWTAVVRDRATDKPYAVDSWYRSNGAPAIVQPLDEWRQALNEPDGD